MKKAFIVIALFFCAINSYSQNYEVIYKIDEYKLGFPDNLESNASLSIIKKGFNKANQHIKDVNFTLKSNNQTAVFSHKENLSLPNDVFNFTQLIIKDTGLDGTIFSDFTINQQFVDKEVLGERFIIKKAIRSQEWTLTKEQSKVLGKTCFIAKRTDSITNSKGLFIRNVKAYYTKEIPLKSGPGSFCGLPGLVLKVVISSENLNYSVFANSVKEIPSFKAKQPKGKTITEENLRKLIADKKKFF